MVSSEDLIKINSSITNGTGLFNDLFNQMNNDIKNISSIRSSYGDAPNMSDDERMISFLNRYFIYKKVRKISDVEKVSLNLQHKYVNEEKYDEEESKIAQEDVKDSLLEQTKEQTKKSENVKINATGKTTKKGHITKLKRTLKI